MKYKTIISRNRNILSLKNNTLDDIEEKFNYNDTIMLTIDGLRKEIAKYDNKDVHRTVLDVLRENEHGDSFEYAIGDLSR